MSVCIVDIILDTKINMDAYQDQCHWQLHEQHHIVLPRWLRLHSRSPGPGPSYPDTLRGYPGGTCTQWLPDETQQSLSHTKLRFIALPPRERLSSWPVYGPVRIVKGPQLGLFRPESAVRGEQPKFELWGQSPLSDYLCVLRNKPSDRIGPIAV